GVYSGSFSASNRYLVSYNQSFDTGTVRVWGDNQISGSTWALDYSAQLYASAASLPFPLRGILNSATVNATYDANAITQLVTATYNGATWDIVGSSTGVLCSGVNAGAATDCPSSNPEFRITITNLA